MIKCKFCEDLDFINKIIVNTKDIISENKVRLVTIDKRKGQKEVCGQIEHDIYELNFCPLCGKKYDLKKIKII